MPHVKRRASQINVFHLPRIGVVEVSEVMAVLFPVFAIFLEKEVRESPTHSLEKAEEFVLAL